MQGRLLSNVGQFGIKYCIRHRIVAGTKTVFYKFTGLQMTLIISGSAKSPVLLPAPEPSRL